LGWAIREKVVGADLRRFDANERRHVQSSLWRATKQATTMEDAAAGICRVLYDQLEAETPAGRTRACVLVRCFKTHRFGLLEPEMQRAAAARLPDGAISTPEMRCMTLLASVGDRPEWCSRHTSQRFRSTPITHDTLLRMPMWRSLFQQCGLDIPGSTSAGAVAGEDDHFIDRSHRSHNVFCVEQALGSASVPEQEGFVVPFQIASVFGFGGQLRRGEVYAVLLFARVPVSRAVATQVNAIALDVTSTLFRFEEADVFARTSEALLST
jgi:two-component system NtrC family sensor kinase